MVYYNPRDLNADLLHNSGRREEEPSWTRNMDELERARTVANAAPRTVASARTFAAAAMRALANSQKQTAAKVRV
jgi:hypothetical protein